MSIIKANKFQSTAGSTFNVPVKIQAFTTTTYWSAAGASAWVDSGWSFSYTPAQAGNKVYMVGQLNLLNETSGLTQNWRLVDVGTSTVVFVYNSMSETAWTNGWWAGAHGFAGELPAFTDTNPKTYKWQVYANTGTWYLNYPYTGLANPRSDVIFYEVAQ